VAEARSPAPSGAEGRLDRAEGRRLFGADPAGYASARPDYPDAVYDALVERCGLGPGCRVLEVGPGPGLVTRRLLAAGARVVAVEPDSASAAYLAEELGEGATPLEVRVSTWEEAQIELGAHDLFVAATSFHWVDQAAGMPKVGQALRPGGWAAIWWTLYHVPDTTDPFGDAADDVLASVRRGFDEPGRPPFQLDQEHRLRDLAELAGLTELGSERIRWSRRLSAAETRALYASMATVLRRPADERARVLDAIEGIVERDFGVYVERPFFTIAYFGQRP